MRRSTTSTTTSTTRWIRTASSDPSSRSLGPGIPWGPLLTGTISSSKRQARDRPTVVLGGSCAGWELVTSEVLQRVALLLPALLLSLSVHEYCHAWVATRLGDPTPRWQGRLTLSPLAHLDPVGSLLFPLILLLTTGSIFGWAKPVQFHPENFRRLSGRKGTALTAVAGPLSNVLLAFLALLALRVCAELQMTDVSETGLAVMLERFLGGLFSLNVLLAVFNLFPLPPLDGSYLLPPSMDGLKDWLTQYSMLLFLVLFFLPLPGIGPIGNLILGPLRTLLSSVLHSIAFAGLGAA